MNIITRKKHRLFWALFSILYWHVIISMYTITFSCTTHFHYIGHSHKLAHDVFRYTTFKNFRIAYLFFFFSTSNSDFTFDSHSSIADFNIYFFYWLRSIWMSNDRRMINTNCLHFIFQSPYQPWSPFTREFKSLTSITGWCLKNTRRECLVFWQR